MYYPNEIKERVKAGMGCGSQIRKGWFDLVRKLDTDIAKIYPDYVVDQVKEKFGGLRYYIGSIPDNISTEDFEEIYKLIHKAEAKSTNICDVCGEDGNGISLNGWYITRCGKHANTKS